jgi:hypothetical protein
VLRLKDPILNEPGLPDGIELPALHEPESIDMRSSSTPSTVARVIDVERLRQEASRRG